VTSPPVARGYVASESCRTRVGKRVRGRGLGAAKNFAAGAGTSHLVTADFNAERKDDVAAQNYDARTVSDGRVDLVQASETDGSIRVFLGNGDGTFWTLAPSPRGKVQFPRAFGQEIGDTWELT
jgi:hypothetical protein